jgi:hypothetical protein
MLALISRSISPASIAMAGNSFICRRARRFRRDNAGPARIHAVS